MAEHTLQPTLDFLAAHAPFDRMSEAQREFLARRLKTAFYPAGSVIASPADGTAQRLHIIKQGRVRGGRGQDKAWELTHGEMFPVGALLAKRPVRTESRALEETFCYELEQADFEQLLAQSPVFQDFCTRRLANLLDLSLREIQARSAEQVTGDEPLAAPLAGLLGHAPLQCAEETTLAEALPQLAARHADHLIVADAQGAPQGIFTLHDLLERVTLPGLPLTTPLAKVMSDRLLSLPATSPAYEAALLMTREGVGHLLVMDGERLAGVISEHDLFTLQGPGLVSLSRALGEAGSIDELEQLGSRIPPMVERMLAHGASLDQLTGLITALNDTLTRRVIELHVAEHDGPLPSFTWLAFGSEGRGEQTLKTDQDNGILFQPAEHESAEAVRERLLPLAQVINASLARCGFPLCPGNIMASNPECCLSLAEWHSRFERWIDRGDPASLLKASIYFDFRPLYGDPAPAESLRDDLLALSQRNSRFRHQLAGNALQFRPPLGLFRDFVYGSDGEHPHSLDLKLTGITPIVDAARIYALAIGSRATATVERLQAAADASALNRGDSEAWIEAYRFLQLQRMRLHRSQAKQGKALDNHLDPDTLNALDRRILKEAFRQARKLQAKLVLEYQL